MTPTDKPLAEVSVRRAVAEDGPAIAALYTAARVHAVPQMPPALHTAEEAYAYLTSLRATMIYGGISDCDMEKGQLRCDANISVRPAGSAYHITPGGRARACSCSGVSRR